MVTKFKALLGGVALGSLLAAAPVLADGMPRGSLKDAPPPVFSWTGFYVGLHAGGAWATDIVEERNPFFSNRTAANSSWSNSGTVGFFGGAQAGYNIQMHGVVVGVEGDIGTLNVNRSTQDPLRTAFPGDSVASLSTGFYGAITGRAGVTLDQKLLLYVKAGWGWVDSSIGYVDTNAAGTTLVNGGSRSLTLDGAVIGGGLEWAFDRNWSVKAEYLHFDLGRVTQNFLISNGNTASFSRDVSVDTVKLGINYRF